MSDDKYGILMKFLKEHEIEKERKDYTHTCVGYISGTTGKFNIDDNDYRKFIKLYASVAETHELNLSEKPKDICPLMTDYDFDFDEKYQDRQYTKKHIKIVSKLLADIIKKYIIVNSEDIMLYVTEKEKPTVEMKNDGKIKKIKDGFHVCAIIPLTREQRYAIYDTLKNKIKNKNVFQSIPVKGTENTNDQIEDLNCYDHIVDISTIDRNNWMMYGSRKQIKTLGPLYHVTHVFNGEMEEFDFSDMSFCDLAKTISVRRYNKPTDKLETNEEYAELISSVAGTYISPVKKQISTEKIIHQSKNITISDKEITMAKKLVKILSKKRAEEENSWAEVGWVLHSIGDIMLQDFIDFSKKCPEKYEVGGCEKLWRSACNYNKPGKTIASLYWMAQQDNPEKYRNIIWESLDKNLVDGLESGTEVDIAQVIFQLYEHRYKCISIQFETWYEFQGHHWVQLEKAHTLRKEIHSNFSLKLIELSQKYIAMSATGTKGEAELLVKKASNIAKLCTRLKSGSFLNSLIHECSYCFLDSDFEKNIDGKTSLIGFTNGVYDLETNTFRPGYPEDNVSLSTGYPYVDYQNNTAHPAFKELDDYFSKVIPNERIREYLLCQLASCLEGSLRDQDFLFWTGTGCHSADTKILMYDGNVKYAKDITIGEQLMGDDSTPRRVQGLFNGTQEMYEITVSDGTSYIVNANHRLALKSEYSGDIRFDDNSNTYVVTYHKFNSIPEKCEKYFNTKTCSREEAYKNAENYLNRKLTKPNVIKYGMIIPVLVRDYVNMNDEIRQYYKNFRNPIEFEQKQIIIDPYKLGTTLGTTGIPQSYKINSTKIRQQLLAGILDKYAMIENDKVTLTLLNHVFMEDCVFLCRSLGFHVDLISENKISLIGDFRNIKTKKITLLLDKYNVIHSLTYEFKVNKIGIGKYYGFSVDKNERYILQNTIVTYNSNGKSMVTKLIKKTFGDYYASMEHTVLTRKRGSASSATPELADKRGVRLVILQEPEQDDKLYTAFIKQISGGDPMNVRKLFQAPFTFTPQFKMIMVCNDLPTIEANDGGTWRRIRVIPFESSFVDHKPAAKYEYSKDRDICLKFPKWHDAFMWLLITKYYAIYKKNGLVEPNEVKIKTSKYRSVCDICNEFIVNSLDVTGLSTDVVTVLQFYGEFKTWFKEAYPNEKMKTKNFILDYFRKSSGYKLIDNEQKIAGMKFKAMDIDGRKEETSNAKSSN